ncbi:uncharacterized protein LOC126751801 [Bactrocera neohumeralis]|uniref:uncharacterized protein LOC126751801 n=1 Tax=Bactrocera neohumeralis TaxID=98809 RepID=UPI002164FC15|nr:uncharacterized protein LOC126751801 [Bactrocera neohumeralis]
MMTSLTLSGAVFILLCCYLNHQQVKAKSFEIVSIRSHVNGDKVALKTLIHDNGTKFDIHATLFKPLRTHDLLMSLKLKRKIEESTSYQNIFHLRQIDVCKFLANSYHKYLSQSLFNISPTTLSQLECPMKPGEYHITNLTVGTNPLVNSLEPGFYRFYVEVAQVSSLAVKVLDMQITTLYKL